MILAFSGGPGHQRREYRQLSASSEARIWESRHLYGQVWVQGHPSSLGKILQASTQAGVPNVSFKKKKKKRKYALYKKKMTGNFKEQRLLSLEKLKFLPVSLLTVYIL